MRTYLTLGFSLILTAAAHGQGTIVLWDESMNGPLSNSGNSPTSLGLVLVGTNTVVGSVEAIPAGGGWGVKNDFFTFNIPAGLRITAVNLHVDRPIWAWIGSGDFSNEYGFAINPSNGDLLTQWGIGPLHTGTYGLYISDNDLQPFPTAANYRLNLAVVPEPASLAILLLGGSALLAFGRRIR